MQSSVPTQVPVSQKINRENRWAKPIEMVKMGFHIGEFLEEYKITGSMITTPPHCTQTQSKEYENFT